MIQSVDDAVKILGGTVETAKICAVGPPAVSNWKTAGQFPPGKFLIIINALNSRGYQVDPTLFGFSKSPQKSEA